MERINRPRKSSRVRGRESKRSSQEPISLSSVALSSMKAATISSMAGSSPGLAVVDPAVIASNQHTDAIAEKSANPYANPMMYKARKLSGKRSSARNSKLAPNPATKKGKIFQKTKIPQKSNHT